MQTPQRKALNLLGIELKDLVAACVGLGFIKNNNASQSEQTKPDRTLLQRSADVEVHQFYEPLSLCDFAATHVLNGSCRQKKMPLCWNKWRGENGAKTTPLRCINQHLFIFPLPFPFWKSGYMWRIAIDESTHDKDFTQYKWLYIYFILKTLLPWPPHQNYQRHIHVTLDCWQGMKNTLNIKHLDMRDVLSCVCTVCVKYCSKMGHKGDYFLFSLP